MPPKLSSEVAIERMREAGVEPQVAYPGADEPWESICLSCGERGFPRLSSVGGRKKSGACKPCGRRRANAAMSLDGGQAVQLMRSKQLEPLVPYPGAGKPWRCTCQVCGAEVSPTYNSARTRATPCRRCADALRGRAQRGLSFEERGKRSVDVEALFAEMEQAGMYPLEDFPGNKRPWRSRCLTCEAVGSPTLGAIRGGQGGCLPCGRRKAAEAAKARRLEEGGVVLEMLAAGLVPLEPYSGVAKSWLCRCEQCGRELRTRLVGVRRGSGCKYCAQYGPDLAGPCVLYVIEHYEWGATKVGIGACVGYNSRLRQHERTGWTVVETWEFETGASAFDVEQAVLDELRDAQLVPFLTAKTMPNGWTETSDRQRVSATYLCSLVENARKLMTSNVGPSQRRRLSANGLIDPEEAATQLRAAGFEPSVPYPGRANLAWAATCRSCGAEGRPRLNGIRSRGSSCRACRARAAGAKKAAANADAAIALMRAAGFEPVDPYPGNATPWRARCMNCDTVSTPRYSNVKQGSTCGVCRKGRQSHPGPSALLSKEQIAEARRLYGAGKRNGGRSLASVAKRFRISSAALSRYLRLEMDLSD